MSLTVMPSTHFSVNTGRKFFRYSIESSRATAIPGIMTFNSSCPAWTAMAMAVSLPTTWKQIMFRHSASDGLILPGMMLDPGWTAGRLISARPVRGPLASRRRSLAMRISSRARFRRAPLMAATGIMLCILSGRFRVDFSGRLTTRPRLATAVLANCSCVFSPVPAADPPRATVCNPSAAASIRSRASLMASP